MGYIEVGSRVLLSRGCVQVVLSTALGFGFGFDLVFVFRLGFGTAVLRLVIQDGQKDWSYSLVLLHLRLRILRVLRKMKDQESGT